VHPERKNPGHAYQKRAPALRWYTPRIVNPALVLWSIIDVDPMPNP